MRAPGYDGNPPIFVEARGSRVIDPATGQVLREAVDGPTNVAVDKLAHLRHCRLIDEVHQTAGRMFQADWEDAERISYGNYSDVRGGGGVTDIAQHKADAMKRRSAAKAHLGPFSFRILEMVCLEGNSVEKAASRLGKHPKFGMGLFVGALDTLARHYGLA